MRLGVDLLPWVLVDGGESVGHMSEFLLKMVLVAELVSSSDEGIRDGLKNGRVVVRAEVEVSVGVGWFSVDLM